MISVRAELLTLGLTPQKVELGAVTVISHSGNIDTTIVDQKLRPLGFELLEDRKLSLVNKVKELVTYVYSGDFDFPYRFRFSDIIEKRLSKDYSIVSTLFAMVERKTLEKYIIEFRIEKTKEMLAYSEATLTDISYKLNYSSVAHLSKQFRQITGMTPTEFRDRRKFSHNEHN